MHFAFASSAARRQPNPNPFCLISSRKICKFFSFIDRAHAADVRGRTRVNYFPYELSSLIWGFRF